MVWEINMGVCPRLELIILWLLIVWGITFIFMVHLSFYAIPLLIYDVMFDITAILAVTSQSRTVAVPLAISPIFQASQMHQSMTRLS